MTGPYAAHARAQEAIRLLSDAGLLATHVGGDAILVTDGRGVVVEVQVRRTAGVVETVWRLLDRIS